MLGGKGQVMTDQKEVDNRRMVTQGSIDSGNKFCGRGGESVDLSVELGKYRRVIERIRDEICGRMDVTGVWQLWKVTQIMKEEGLEVG